MIIGLHNQHKDGQEALALPMYEQGNIDIPKIHEDEKLPT